MRCEQIQSQLGLYVDGELSDEIRRDVESHLRDCSRCAAELASLQALAAAFRAERPVTVPDSLWGAIEGRVGEGRSVSPKLASVAAHPPRRSRNKTLRRLLAAAASIVFVAGVALLGIAWLGGTWSTASASCVDFSELLDGLAVDPREAFRTFLTRHEARKIPAERAREAAPELDFEVPDVLPGDFRREAVYVMRFGDAPGVAAEYRSPDGEFLAAIFHEPVHREDFGTHRDYPCVVGQHRGHAVSVGSWHLVHLTDPSTCHCVLSRLDAQTELPPVMSAVAPRSSPMDTTGDSH